MYSGGLDFPLDSSCPGSNCDGPVVLEIAGEVDRASRTQEPRIRSCKRMLCRSSGAPAAEEEGADLLTNGFSNLIGALASIDFNSDGIGHHVRSVPDVALRCGKTSLSAWRLRLWEHKENEHAIKTLAARTTASEFYGPLDVIGGLDSTGASLTSRPACGARAG